MRRNWLARAGIVLTLMAFLFSGCGEENPFAPSRNDNEVWITSSSFDPSTLTVSVGTTVRWINQDNVVHDITGGSSGNPDNSVITPSPPMNANESHAVTFTAAGSFKFFCTIHPTKTGTIVVR